MELMRRRGPAESALAPLDRPFFDDVDRLFGSFFPTSLAALMPFGHRAMAASFMPAVDLLEEDDRLVVKADLPGVDPDSLNVEYDSGYLRLSAKRSSEREERQGGYYQLERSFGSFQRVLRLPDGVDPAEINAVYKDGVLEVSVPKAAVQVQAATKIPIAGVVSQVIEGEATEQPEEETQTDS